MSEFGMPFALDGETPAEYQARFEEYRRMDRDSIPSYTRPLAAAGRREEFYLTPSGNKIPVYHTDRSEEAIRTLIKRLYSASWAR